MNAIQLSFDDAQRLKDKALDGLGGKYPDFLSRARHVAVGIAEREGEVSADDVREVLAIPVDIHPSVLGALFRGPQWKRIGYRPSSQPQRKAGVIGVWMLRKERRAR